MNKLKINKIELPDYIVHLRPTSPIRDPKLIDLAIRKIHNFKKFTSLRSIHQMDESAYKTAEIINNKLVSSFKRDKELDKINDPQLKYPKTYFTNGYVDILKTSFIIKNQKIHGNNVYPFMTTDPIDIDKPEKLKYLEFILKKKNESQKYKK